MKKPAKRKKARRAQKREKTLADEVADEVKKAPKHRKIIWAAAILILLLTLFSVAKYKTSYIIGEDLVLVLKPETINLELFNSQQYNIRFEVSTNNKISCRASCEAALDDLSTGKKELADARTLEPREPFVLNWSSKAPKYGKGQTLYQFTVKCHNIKQFGCPTGEEEVQRTALASINYGPSEELQGMITRLGERLTAKIKESNKAMLYFSSLENANRQEKLLQRNISAHQEMLEKLGSDSIEMIRLWDLLLFDELNEEIGQYELDILGFSHALDELNKTLQSEARAHNEIVQRISGFDLTDLADYYRIGKYENEQEIIEDANQTAANLREVIRRIREKTYNTSKTKDEVLMIESDLKEIHDDMGRYHEEIDKELKAIDLENHMLCKLRESCTASIVRQANTSMTEKCKDAFQLSEERDDREKIFFLQFSNESNKSLTELQQKAIYSAGIQDMTNMTDFLKRADYLVNRTYAEFHGQTANQPIILNQTIANLSERMIKIGLKLDETMNFTYLHNKCAISNNTEDITEGINLMLPLAELNMTPVNITLTDPTLKEHKAVCCVFGECKECCQYPDCEDDEASFPLIILHGHAFNMKTSPDYSLNSFVKIENKLQGDGYINAGFISPKVVFDEESKGRLGLTGNPVFLTTTYYYDVYNEEGEYLLAPQKSENIDTYALRLKDIVDNVIYKTGRAEVNILAHSMGGLVTRRYMQIFGDDKVNKLIMLGTPNKGITGSTQTACGLFGGNKECGDMTAGSIFIKKVNDENLQPDDAELYTVTGWGCDMDGRNGDGVVLAENVMIYHARNFNMTGNCSFFTTLHTEMLDIDKYPQVYEDIREALD
ncbi:alpha/beta hydrolase [Candidatus Woesearchaeota archaeon]|nr:alpha/beta hydrolase [Candidatus Woesearchaeota archaeon]